MKKVNLKLAGIAEMLNKEQMKKITGGYFEDGLGSCSSNADCPAGSYCSHLAIGDKRVCIETPRGSSCITDSDCGNGLHCVPSPGGNNWCN